MSGIPTLIRLRKQAVDEARARLAEAEGQRDALLKRDRALVEALAAEGQAAKATLEAGRAFAGFVRRVIAERARLAKEIAAAEAAATRAAEELVACYRELKKFELAQASAEAARLAEEVRRERAELDEIAAEVHRRRGENGLSLLTG